MRAIILAALLLAMPITPAWSASIGLFSDPNGTSCNLSIPSGGTGRFYVIAERQGWVIDGITGAEFRISGLPPGWQVAAVEPNPTSNVVLGSPLGAGTNIAFPSFQVAERVLLFTIDLTATSSVGDVVLRVVAHQNPSNPNFACPKLTGDSGPVFVQICVGPAQLFINSATSCAVGVTAATWSSVKSLFD